MTNKQLLDKIAQLEKRITELEARPPEQHVHYHYAPIGYIPPPVSQWTPVYPYTCGIGQVKSVCTG